MPFRVIEKYQINLLLIILRNSASFDFLVVTKEKFLRTLYFKEY